MPGRELTVEETTEVKGVDHGVGIAQDNLDELLADRARLWGRLLDDGVAATSIARATGKTRGAIVAAVAVRRKVRT